MLPVLPDSQCHGSPNFASQLIAGRTYTKDGGSQGNTLFSILSNLRITYKKRQYNGGIVDDYASRLDSQPTRASRRRQPLLIIDAVTQQADALDGSLE